MWKSKWKSWATVPNKPTVSLNAKQHFNQPAKFETLKAFLCSVFHRHVKGLLSKRIAFKCYIDVLYKTGKCNVCRRVRAAFIPEVLQVAAMKGLMLTRRGKEKEEVNSLVLYSWISFLKINKVLYCIVLYCKNRSCMASEPGGATIDNSFLTPSQPLRRRLQLFNAQSTTTITSGPKPVAGFDEGENRDGKN